MSAFGDGKDSRADTIKERLNELIEELEQLRKADEACDYALHYIYETESSLPSDIHMSHHAGMEMEEVKSDLQERIDELEYKIGEI